MEQLARHNPSQFITCHFQMFSKDLAFYAEFLFLKLLRLLCCIFYDFLYSAIEVNNFSLNGTPSTIFVTDMNDEPLPLMSALSHHRCHHSDQLLKGTCGYLRRVVAGK